MSTALNSSTPGIAAAFASGTASGESPTDSSCSGPRSRNSACTPDSNGSPARPQSAVRQVLLDTRDSLGGLLDGWNHFWFTACSTRSLSLLRLLIGGMVVYSHLVWGLRLQEFIGPNGWLPETLVGRLQEGSYAMSFWWWVTPPLIMPVHILCVLVLLAFALGLRTAITSKLAWAIVVSYAHRLPLANFGLDQICGVLLFYLMWVPCGDYFSLDAVLARRRGAAPPPTLSLRAGLVRRMLQVHIAILYFSAGTSKLQGVTWWTGEALWNAIANLEYQSGSLTWLAGFPLLLSILAHGTVLWEVAFPAIIWPRSTRWLALLPGVLMHLGIGMFLGMWTFGLAMIFSYVAFLPASLSPRSTAQPVAGLQAG